MVRFEGVYRMVHTYIHAITIKPIVNVVYPPFVQRDVICTRTSSIKRTGKPSWDGAFDFELNGFELFRRILETKSQYGSFAVCLHLGILWGEGERARGINT